MNTRGLDALASAGVSAWLDDLSRGRLVDGSLERLITDLGVRGVTTNPAIFHKAITAAGGHYDDQMRACAANGLTAEQTVTALTVQDVTNACDLFAPVFERTAGIDGRVSIEVDPRLAHDTERTIAAAKELHTAVARPNVMIKIPATLEGLPAISAVLGAGISVNVTLIFSVERYLHVMDAFAEGLEIAQAAGHDVSRIHSVASFFVSRVDSAVDALLDQKGSEAAHLHGQAAVANAHLAWAAFTEFSASPRWQALAPEANLQRPLWASTGVKNPSYSPTKYVDELIAAPSVNTMPEPTLLAAAESTGPRSDSVSAHIAHARAVWMELESLGISQTAVLDTLERDGVQQFIDSWEALLSAVEARLSESR